MIAIITINYNLSEETILCIDSLLNSKYGNFKIYLIDNGSSIEDYQVLLKTYSYNPKIEIIRIDKNCGYVGGVNTGLKKASDSDPDYFMVMNNDTIIDEEAIGILVKTAKKYNNKAIVSGKVYYYNHPDILQHTGEIITDSRFNFAASPGKNEKDVGQYDKELERDVLDDVFWLIPSGILKDVGYYCDYFFLYAEQADYSFRARGKGYKLIFSPEAKLWHKVSMTSGGGDIAALPVCYWRGQGLFVMQNRYLKTQYFILILVRCFTVFAAKALFKNGKDKECAIALLRGYLWGFQWMVNKRPNNGQNPYLRSK